MIKSLFLVQLWSFVATPVFASDCAAVGDAIKTWKESDGKNAVTAELFAVNRVTGGAYAITTGGLIYSPSKTIGNPPFEIPMPPLLETPAPVLMRSSQSVPTPVNLRLSLGAEPELVIQDAAANLLWDSFISHGECIGTDRIGGTSHLGGTAYLIRLEYVRLPD